MKSYALPSLAIITVIIVHLFGGSGCQENTTSVDEAKVQRYQERMAGEAFEPATVLTELNPQPPVDLVGQVSPASLSLDTTIWLYLPDPTIAEAILAKRLEITKYGNENIKKEYRKIFEDTLKHAREIQRPNQFRLTLADALRRALANNYQIQVSGYAPAISTAQVVQAEAAFDLAFFANVNRNNTDRPMLRQTIPASQVDSTVVAGGIAKLLETGATVSLSPQMSRSDNGRIPDPAIDPVWGQNFVAELRQPLMRNFGIDFNRAQINISKNERLSNLEALRSMVTDILTQTERQYWVLAAARRNVVISAELLSQAILTYTQIQARKDYDAYQTLLYRSEATVRQRESEYIDVKNQVRNAEDQLMNLLNDPELPPSQEYEIVPIDNPTTVEVLRDRFHAVETAIEHRPEVRQARYNVENAKLGLGIAKNQALPQVDAVYRATFSGYGASADQAWDQMSTSNFIDHFVGLELRWSPGERRERAGIRIAALQQSQAVISYKRILDNIITDCRVALRDIETNYEQIGPTYQGVIAASENLRSLQERQERKSPEQLDTILSAQTGLAQARRSLLTALLQYNQGMVNVERAKGTLLEYNNVVLTEQP